MDHAIVVCGVAPAKLIQIAKRRLMIKQAPAFSSSNNDTTLRILERSIQALDRLIRICNNSNGNTNNQSSNSSSGGGGSNTLRFNHAQCRFLDLQGFHDNLRNLLDEIASLDASRREQCITAAVEIARVTSNAEALVANWAPETELFEEWGELQDSWMIRGMLCAADEGLAAAQQNHEQQWCISVLEVVMAQFRADRDDASKHANTKKKQSHHVPYWMIDRTFEIAEESLVLDEDRGLEQATRLDRRRLLDKLKKMRQRNEGFFRGLSSMLFRASSSKNKSSSRRQELVSYLLSKLDADDEGESRIESYIERIHQSEAWADSYATISSSNELILGRGCFGSVQRSEFLGFPAARKTAPACSRDDFWNEVAVLAGMQHPRLAQLLFASIDEEARVCRLWTELLGKDLDAVLQQQQQQEEEEDGGELIGLLVAVEIMLQIAEGMAYLHKKGILHRHLKASNVLLVPAAAAAASNKMRSVMRKRKKGMSSSNKHGLDEFVRVKITDYGLPKTKLAGPSSASSSMGSIHRLRFWQAPEAFEQTSPRAQFTRRSDVYSFAMLCYHILSSKRPFSDFGCSDEEDLFRMVCIDRARPELPRQCPPYLAALIQRCWSHEPELRPSFAQICFFLKSFKALLIRSPLQQQQQQQQLLLPFTPSDFGNLRKHLGLGFFVDAIAMLKQQQEVLLDQGLLDSWPFPMDAFVLWLGSSVEQLENEEGFGAAAEMAGDFLADWTGPRHEFEQAVFWYYKASSSSGKSSSASARWKLGMCVELGLGLARDEKRAFGLYKQAAREGFVSAHVELGRCYQTGKGVTRNADKAVAHFAKALELFDDNGSSSDSSSLQCVEFLMRMLARAAAEEDCVWAAERIQEIAARSRSGRMIVAGRGCCNVRELVGMLGDWRVKEVGRRKAKMVLERLAVEEDILQQALLA